MSAAPIVIAHRGASGYLPEHTLESKVLAYGLGADFLEQDVVATRDGQLVVLHDLYLDDVSDVATRFPGRARADGHYYVIDFDLAELRTLEIGERRAAASAAPRFPGRFPVGLRRFHIATLAEELTLVRELNRVMGRHVGVYPEIKHPAWHREHGIDLAASLLAALDAFGYRHPEDPVFVQCFDEIELRRVKQELGCNLKLIQLVGAEARYGALLSETGLRAVKEYAWGIGPSYSQLATVGADGALRLTSLTDAARAAGLALHPYTFRADELPPYARSLEELIAFFMVQARVGGLFCDQPDVAVRVRDSVLKVH
jgi:glycerophosphoryl diester phosphodiesterase